MRSLMPLVAALSLATPVLARPITYPGGGMAMFEHANESSSNEVMYTVSPKHSLALRSDYDQEFNWQFQGAGANYLAWRHNAEDGQANVYLMGSVGVMSEDRAAFGKDAKAAAMTMVEADWENRRFFVLGQVKAFAADGGDRSLAWRGRVGVAPYVGEYGDLHTWLMLQVDHKPESKDPVLATALVRFFKGPVLVEVGASQKGDAFASAMFYF
jgi:hypothetical protein